MLYIVAHVLQFFPVAGYWKCSNKTSTLIEIFVGFVDDVLRPQILSSRLGISA